MVVTNVGLSRIYAPMVTPYTDGLEIDYDSAATLAGRIASHGIGVFVSGTTGEITSMVLSERRELLSRVREAVSGKASVIVGTASPNPTVVMVEASTLSGESPDAIVVPPPFYYPVPGYSVEGFYRWLAKYAGSPIIVYTIPSHVGFNVPVEVLESLSRVEGIAGVKATVDSSAYQARLLSRLSNVDGFRVYTGFDHLLPYSLVMGGWGGIVAGANLVPALHKFILDSYLEGDMKDFTTLSRILPELAWILEPARSTQGGIKAILASEGIIGSDAVRPPLPPEDEHSRRLVLERWRASQARDYFD